jgi:chromosomal replication initiation ATPase DnaA
MNCYVFPGILKKKKLSIKEIETIVLEKYLQVAGIKANPENLLSKKRQWNTITFPRFLIFTLAREFTNETYSSIGKQYNQNHATVIHAENAIRNFLFSDPQHPVSRTYHHAKNAITKTINQ